MVNRFQKPVDESFRVMLELFCRAPEGIYPAEGAHLTPIPIDDAIASLSAILVDDEYYEFIRAGRKEVDGLPMVGEDRLIPLKARAWLDLTERHARGTSGWKGSQGGRLEPASSRSLQPSAARKAALRLPDQAHAFRRASLTWPPGASAQTRDSAGPSKQT